MYIGFSTIIWFFVGFFACCLFGIGIAYIYYLLKRQWYYSSNVFELLRSLRKYLAYLEELSKLSIHYGDRTLMELVQQTKQVEQEIRFFFSGFSAYSEEELKDVYDDLLKQQIVADEKKEKEEMEGEDPNKPKTVATISSIKLPGGALDDIAEEKKE